MFSKQRLLSLSILVLIALSVACAADEPTTPAATVADGAVLAVGSGVSASLKGFAVLNENGEEVALGALKYSDGTVAGFASGVNPGTLNGPVVELVPPHGAFDFWCANMAVANVPEFQGFNFLWLIRDLGNGKSSFDQLATNGGFGLTCAAGPGGPFAPVVSGNFRGTTR